jgi:hypothetical protein
MSDHGLAHCVSVLCDAPATAALAYLADPERLGEWALGCWGARADGDGLVRGRSLFDGSATLVRTRLVEDARTVDFEVGGDPEQLVRRISARVVGGEELGVDADRSLVILLAWRTSSMDDDRWHRLVAAHEAEVFLLRERIERSVAA